MGAPFRFAMGIAPHIRLAFLGEDLVVFDLQQDRYLALPGAIESAVDQALPVRRLSHPQLYPEASQMLAAAGFLLPGGSDWFALTRPERVLSCDEAEISITDYLRLLSAVTRVGWRIRRGRHVAHYSACHLPACSGADRERLQLAVGKLRRLRLFLPTPARCLPAALTAAFFLHAFDLEVDLVFGVRAHPFDAHCWIERDGMVLDDDLDRIRAYTPIAIGVPCR